MTIEVRISKNHWRRLGFYAYEDGLSCVDYCKTLGVVPTEHEKYYLVLGYLYHSLSKELPIEWMDN